jgi:hypothetical protein
MIVTEPWSSPDAAQAIREARAAYFAMSIGLMMFGCGFLIIRAAPPSLFTSNLVVPAQEFIHRGVIQTGTRGCLDPGPWVFAFVHLFRPPLLACGVVVPSIFWGFTLSHAVLGWFTLECLSLDKVVGL